MEAGGLSMPQLGCISFHISAHGAVLLALWTQPLGPWWLLYPWQHHWAQGRSRQPKCVSGKVTHLSTVEQTVSTGKPLLAIGNWEDIGNN